MSYS
jgi:ribonuclease D